MANSRPFRPSHPMSEPVSLLGLFVASFLAATLLPGGSEAVVLGVLAAYPDLLWPAFLLATLGNTLGGLSTYLMAWLLPEKALHKLKPHHLNIVRRWGAPGLVLAWVPLLGDFLCVAAGWLRLPWWSCTLWLALGKGLRYAVLIAGWRWLAA